MDDGLFLFSTFNGIVELVLVLVVPHNYIVLSSFL